VNRPGLPAESQPPGLADPVILDPPQHPMYALTTYELRDYRRQLESAIAFFDTKNAEHTPVRELLQGRLAEVLAEQHSRTKIADAAR
jgi:hypothetical protein